MGNRVSCGIRLASVGRPVLFFLYEHVSHPDPMWTVDLIFIVLIPAVTVWILHCLNVSDRLP